MKRVVSVFVCMMMVVGLIGCDDTEGNDAGTSSGVVAEEGFDNVQLGTEAETKTESETETKTKTLLPSVTLEEVERIEKNDREYCFSDCLSIKNDTDYTLCRYDGTELSGLHFNEAEKINSDTFILKRQGKKMVESAIVLEDGTVLVDWGHYIIDVLNDRYLMVGTLEKKTKNKEKAIGYVTSSMVISLSPQKGDTLYTGYKRVYDLKEQRFVPNIKCTSGYAEFEACGDSLKIRDDKGDIRIYDNDGEVLVNKAGDY